MDLSEGDSISQNVVTLVNKYLHPRKRSSGRPVFWNSSKKCQKSNRCRCQKRAVCPQHLGVGALAGRASSVRFSVSLKFPRAIWPDKQQCMYISYVVYVILEGKSHKKMS